MFHQIHNVNEEKNYIYKKILNKLFGLEVKKKTLEEPMDLKVE